MEKQVLQKLSRKIQDLKKTAGDLRVMGAAIPAVERNALRIQATIKMLELNISDIMDPGSP
jgi:hypothetical protein